MERTNEKKWHLLSPEEVLGILESDSVNRLDRSEIENRRRRFGANVITAKKGRGSGSFCSSISL